MYSEGARFLSFPPTPKPPASATLSRLRTPRPVSVGWVGGWCGSVMRACIGVESGAEHAIGMTQGSHLLEGVRCYAAMPSGPMFGPITIDAKSKWDNNKNKTTSVI